MDETPLCGQWDDPVFGGRYGRRCARRLHHLAPCSEVPDPPGPDVPPVLAAPSWQLPPVEVDDGNAPPVGEVLPFPGRTMSWLIFGGQRLAVRPGRRAGR